LRKAGTSLEATQRAAELLEKRGVIETRQQMNQYRLKAAR
jgi:hypothetical protein